MISLQGCWYFGTWFDLFNHTALQVRFRQSPTFLPFLYLIGVLVFDAVLSASVPIPGAPIAVTFHFTPFRWESGPSVHRCRVHVLVASVMIVQVICIIP
ncbi:hypothetical protein SLEP1_g4237 [Rubroshorea leprosula]|uniref:Uncharacterized protein n=1 Tax=Rubroshorea leprosula TaxID=152421 RepID=A0AAV5HN24_9ROSI|nr:hypothetical protein SLEP1_g4237 [Rubroshorea leprosula]